MIEVRHAFGTQRRLYLGGNGFGACIAGLGLLPFSVFVLYAAREPRRGSSAP